ncbi:hypothetical protein AXK11_08930 [Cephaloticoccus primus]|uniref:PEP-CTERM protein-sorting domain-containing protein n=2 Tax=Cephaloticoccus primus TaxID=1548207 RepID=A0A139SHJ5_9BACT|nr:hypothetical protein AXK11_08930 [Cephaloticoccus primus]
MYIRDGAVVQVMYNEQIANGSKVSLISKSRAKASSIGFLGQWQTDIKETIGELAVSGYGVVDFGFDGKANGEQLWPAGDHGKRWFYIDDLYISYGSLLTIKNWKYGRDFLLVKKGTWNLEEMLKRMEFEGYDRNAIHLESFNWEYWQISGAPEPATYGAVLSIAVLSAFLLRKRRKACLARA